MLAEHGPGNTVATDESNGRTLLAFGWQHVFAGRYPNTLSLVQTDQLADWQWELVHSLGINYVLVDRRTIAANNMLGYFFDREPGPQLPASDWLPPAVYLKYDQMRLVSRELDSGDVVIYNLRELMHAAAQP